MSEDAPEFTIARLREQLLLAQVRINELEAELSAADRRIEFERRLTDEAQNLADRYLTEAANASALAENLEGVRSELAAVAARLTELDGERKAMQRSRSWRWTSPIRAIERWWSGKK